MNKLGSKRNIIIVILLIVAVLIIYGIAYFSVIRPMQAETSTLEKEAVMYERQYNIMVNKTSENIDDENQTDIQLQIPKQKYPDNILINLQKIAGSTNVIIDHLAAEIDEKNSEIEAKNAGESGNKTASNIKKATFSLEASSTNLGDMNAFIDALKDSERLVTIGTLHLNKNSSKAISLAVRFATYYTTD